MHMRSRILLVAGALILVALTPHLLDEESALRSEVAVLSAAPGSTSEGADAAAGEATTGIAEEAPGTAPEVPFDAELFEHTTDEVTERAPKPTPRRLRGDHGACPSGVVVLTFDDGPDPDVTPGLLRTLTDLGVPATFFMVGRRVAAEPALARKVAEAGFTVANHTYAHELMTRQTDAAVRTTLRRTQRAFREAGLKPTRLMRPPYGGIDRRVERAIRGERYVPVLWDVDPRDWETRRSTDDIASGVLGRLRPGRSNVVLQHDGVRNSRASARAVERIVRTARKRGFCFGDLDDRGRAVLPTPRVSAITTRVDEGREMRIRLRLNAASARRTSVHVQTVDGTALAGRDYEAVSERVVFPAGRTRAQVTVRTTGDGVHGRAKRLTLRLTDGQRLRIGTEEVALRIRNADPAPKVRLLDTRVERAVARSDRARVTVRLSEVSERPVRVRITEARGERLRVRRTVVVPAGQRKVTVGVRLRGATKAKRQQVRVRIAPAEHARPAGKPARLVVRRSR